MKLIQKGSNVLLSSEMYQLFFFLYLFIVYNFIVENKKTHPFSNPMQASIQLKYAKELVAMVWVICGFLFFQNGCCIVTTRIVIKEMQKKKKIRPKYSCLCHHQICSNHTTTTKYLGDDFAYICKAISTKGFVLYCKGIG